MIGVILILVILAHNLKTNYSVITLLDNSNLE